MKSTFFEILKSCLPFKCTSIKKNILFKPLISLCHESTTILHQIGSNEDLSFWNKWKPIEISKQFWNVPSVPKVYNDWRNGCRNSRVLGFPVSAYKSIKNIYFCLNFIDGDNETIIATIGCIDTFALINNGTPSKPI
jgi:hypothetical protein